MGRTQPPLDLIERPRSNKVIELQQLVTRLQTCSLFAAAGSNCVNGEGARHRLPFHRLAAGRFGVRCTVAGLELDRYCRSSTAAPPD